MHGYCKKLTIVWSSYAQKSEETSKKVLKTPRTSSHAFLRFHNANLRQRSDNWYNEKLEREMIIRLLNLLLSKFSELKIQVRTKLYKTRILEFYETFMWFTRKYVV
uniref:Uncharacterized protein n=1 Tax=Solanum tuberosum TaxID=4113 RepID=M1CYQ6_SOLTU